LASLRDFLHQRFIAREGACAVELGEKFGKYRHALTSNGPGIQAISTPDYRSVGIILMMLSRCSEALAQGGAAALGISLMPPSASMLMA
jgi:hypothetical protein